MNYSTKRISTDLKTLAVKIKNEVPYWQHYRPVLALKKSLKKCYELESTDNNTSILQTNKGLLIECLIIFKIIDINTAQDYGNSLQD